MVIWGILDDFMVVGIVGIDFWVCILKGCFFLKFSLYWYFGGGVSDMC